MLTLLLALSRVEGLQDPPLEFGRQVLTDRYLADGIQAGDLNRDGKMDVVSGPYWYEGPDFKTAREIYPAVDFERPPSPTDAMFAYVHDFDGDGWPDVLRLGRVHLHQAFWYRNPGTSRGPWTKHFVFERVLGESPPFLDVDGDGRPELVSHWEKRWGLLGPDPADAAKPWIFRPVTEAAEFHQFYHGTGIGDLDGDGKPDLILNEGWWKQGPGAWAPRPFKFGERGGAQMFATDVDGDGDADVVTAIDAHGWGIAWFEQTKDGWTKHPIMGGPGGEAFSQPHALAMADMDGDGLPDLVAGKRRWAHGPKGDVDPDGTPVIYWWRLVRKPEVRFVPYRIDDNSGVGVQIAAVDVSGDGVPDVLSASKLGAFVFRAKKR